MNHVTVRAGAAAMGHAAQPFMQGRHAELANAVATLVSAAEDGADADVYEVAIRLIDHRVKNQLAQCPQKKECARAMQRAWKQATGDQNA